MKHEEAKDLFNLFMPKGVTPTEQAIQQVAKYNGVEDACYDGVALMVLENRLNVQQFSMARRSIERYFLQQQVKKFIQP